MNPHDPAAGGRQPKVSVILPVQDAAARVGAVIRSIRAQTLSEWELILVGTGSADSTSATVASIARSDERIRVMVANGPFTEVRHAGFLSARGAYIYCLDASHCSLPDTLQRLCDCLDTQLEAPVAYGVLDSLTPESNSLHAFQRLGAEGFLNTGAVAIRRSALNAALADPECDFEDQWLWWSLLREGPAAFVEGKALSISNPLSSACSVLASASSAPEMKQTPSKLAYLIAAHY